MSNHSYQVLSQDAPSIQETFEVPKKRKVPPKTSLTSSSQVHRNARRRLTKRVWLEVAVVLFIGVLGSMAIWFTINQLTTRNVSFYFYGNTFSRTLVDDLVSKYMKRFNEKDAPIIFIGDDDENCREELDRLRHGSAAVVILDNPIPQHVAKDFIVVPFAAGSVIPVINMNSAITGKSVPFNLTREMLVGSYNGTYTSFCESPIIDINPSYASTCLISPFNTSKITPIHRTNPSGTNFVFTNALASFSPEWKAKYSPALDLLNWPMPNPGKNITVAKNDQMLNYLSLYSMSIGYVPWSAFLRSTQSSTLIPVFIMDSDLQTVSTPDALNAAISYYAHENPPPSQNQYYDLTNLPCPNCWPIASYAYIITLAEYSTRIRKSEVIAALQLANFMLGVTKVGNNVGPTPSQVFQNINYFQPAQQVRQQAIQQLSKIRYNKSTFNLYPFVQYDWLGVGLVSGTAVILAIVRILVALQCQPKQTANRPKSRVTADEMRDGSQSSLMRQILESDPSITSAPVRMEENLRRSFIDTQELVMQTQIGRGSFGEVYMGTYAGAVVAIKRMLLPTSSERMTVVETFVREAGLMASLRHPNIVQFLGAAVSHPYLFLITEYCSQGSLHDVLHGPSAQTLTRDRKRVMLIDACLGIMYLHGKGIVHRDIKTQNLLVDRLGNVKVADFGTSTNTLGEETGPQIRTMCGTPEYVAPEVVALNSPGYTHKADVFSFGVVMWEVWSSQLPYSGLRMVDILYEVTNNDLRPPIEAIGNEPLLSDLITRCWQKDPSSRPSFDEVLTVLRDMEDADFS